MLLQNNALERDLHLASHGFPPGSLSALSLGLSALLVFSSPLAAQRLDNTRYYHLR